jgi:hypothetical protein
MKISRVLSCRTIRFETARYFFINYIIAVVVATKHSTSREPESYQSKKESSQEFHRKIRFKQHCFYDFGQYLIFQVMVEHQCFFIIFRWWLSCLEQVRFVLMMTWVTGLFAA